MQTLRIKRELHDAARPPDPDGDGTMIVLLAFVVIAWAAVGVMAWQVFAK